MFLLEVAFIDFLRFSSQCPTTKIAYWPYFIDFFLFYLFMLYAKVYITDFFSAN